MQRPGPEDHVPYFSRYVDLVPEGNVLETLGSELERSRELLRGIDEERALFRYAPKKWSIKELWGHLCDTERIFGARCLASARGESNPYPSFDEDAYVAVARFDERQLSDLFAEFEHLRRSNLHLFASLGDDEGARLGWAYGGPIRVRAYPWILAGHEMHHRRVLEERYLSPAAS